eukprot:4196443-Pleurochrysis_carterae.AAC.2
MLVRIHVHAPASRPHKVLRLLVRGNPSNCSEPASMSKELGGAARLLLCPTRKFSDSRGYVLTHSHASSIMRAHEALLAADGKGGGRCKDPWNSRGCADDPGVLGVYFKQCDAQPDTPPAVWARLDPAWARESGTGHR